MKITIEKHLISIVGIVCFLILAGGSLEDSVTSLVEKETQKLMDEAEKETQKLMDEVEKETQKLMDEVEKETQKLMDEVYDSYETKSSSKPASNNGKYVYDSSDGTLTVTISGSSWRGKTVIKTGFGSDYDNQQAQYSRGIVNGNDLYDESGYIKVGYVSGNSVSMDGYSLYKE